MKVKSKIFYWYAAFALIHIGLTLLPAPARETLVKYHLSSGDLKALQFTLLIPSLVMWFAVFYGYQRLHAYSQIIKGNKDGKQVAKLAHGLLALAVGIPLNSILSDVLTLFARHHPDFIATATVISNYTSVLYPLIAFIFISMGARGLIGIARVRVPLLATNITTLVAIILGVVFCDLIARAHHDLITTYHLSYSLVMLTLAIPYLYIWFLGLFAVVEIYLYSRHVAGIVYRHSWNELALGLGAIIVLDITLQYLGTLSSWLSGLSLSGLLLLLYVLLFLLAAAFIVVALGTKKLIRIEEV
jgi:hypothetical protein